jgi:hypothetical protein
MLFCGSVIDHADTGLKTYVGVFNNLVAPRNLLEAGQVSFCMACLRLPTAGASKIRFYVQSKETMLMDDTIDVSGITAHSDFVVRLNGIKFEQEGSYMFGIFVDDELFTGALDVTYVIQ